MLHTSIHHILNNQEIEINIWDTVADDRYVTSKKLLRSAYPKFYSILYNLQPASLQLEKINHHQQFYRIREPFMLFLPKKAVVQFKMLPNAHIKMIEINLSEKYFEKEGSAAELELRQCPVAAISQLHNLFTLCLEKTPDIQKIINLHSEILKVCISETSNVVQSNKSRSIHYEKMFELKKLIEESVQSELPPLPVLAQKFNMAASTLKRQFKINFGVNIYHYYLQKKMDAALELLQEGKHTVNEIAELLGYANVSNFIDIFKKHYGNSPGNYKRLLLTETMKTS